MRHFFQTFWYRKEPKKNRVALAILFLLSEIYRWGLYLREYLLCKKAIKTVPVPVVSVGNLSVGGEGKTPLVMRIASFFVESGFKPAVITRGYRRKKSGIFSVNTEKHDSRVCGDEAYLMAKNLKCPVVVGKKREEAAKKAIEEHGANLVILDDGFQVRTLKKDVEVVVIKTARSSLNFNLFPLGPMREPLESIRRSDIIVLNQGFKSTLTSQIPESLLDSIPVFYCRLKVLNLCNIRTNTYKDYNYLRGKEIVAFSGLADNDSFFNLLKDIGARLKHVFSFPDHHFYTGRDIRRILKRKADIYVTTEKDAVKLQCLDIPDTFYYLSVEMTIEREKEFFSTILNLIEKKHSGECIWKKEFISSTQP